MKYCLLALLALTCLATASPIERMANTSSVHMKPMCATGTVPSYSWMTPQISRAGGLILVVGSNFCNYCDGTPYTSVVAYIQSGKTRSVNVVDCQNMLVEFTESDLVDSNGNYTPQSGHAIYFVFYIGSTPYSFPCSSCITLSPTPTISSFSFSGGFSVWPYCGGPTLTINGDDFPNQCSKLRYVDMREYNNPTNQINVLTTFATCSKTQITITTTGGALANHCYHVNLALGWGDIGTSYTEVQNAVKACDTGNTNCGGYGLNYCNSC